MALPIEPTPVIGRVASVNPKGIRLDGSDEWLNVSKFGSDVVLPERGATVSVTLDSRGFIRSLVVLDGPSSFGPPSRTSSTPSSRDTTITRLAVLKAAAKYAASKPESKSGDVLKIAPVWERWVLREPDAGDDLTDAF